MTNVSNALLNVCCSFDMGCLNTLIQYPELVVTITYNLKVQRSEERGQDSTFAWKCWCRPCRVFWRSWVSRLLKAGIGWVLPYQTIFQYLVENQTKPILGNWLRSNPNQTLPYCTKPKPFLGGKVRLGKFLSYQTILHPEVNSAVVPHQNYQLGDPAPRSHLAN